MCSINDDMFLNDQEKKDALHDDEQPLNQEFLFDEKNFQTLLISNNTNAGTKKILDVEKFIQQYDNAYEKNDLLLWLKKNNYKDLLMEQIENTTDEGMLSKLLCTYWEAGFDDDKDMIVFIPYLLSHNFHVALEAYTNITGLSKPFPADDVQKALQMIQQVYNDLPSENIFLVDEVIQLLNSELSEKE
ncbi:MAG: hypothetical protein N2203_03985 [Bacteroidia bacterium]|nr:hypothetical protein [Bacteroidia bacterium]